MIIPEQRSDEKRMPFVSERVVLHLQENFALRRWLKV
jgi:hypothetical protein